MVLGDPVKGPFDTQRSCDVQVENLCSRSTAYGMVTSIFIVDHPQP